MKLLKTLFPNKLPHFIKCDWAPWSEIVNCYEAPYQFKFCIVCNKIKKRRVAFTGNEVNTKLWNHKHGEEAHGIHTSC